MIHRPETERGSRYFEAVLSDQFDAWLWFEDTRMVAPLVAVRPHGVPRPIRSECEMTETVRMTRFGLEGRRPDSGGGGRCRGGRRRVARRTPPSFATRRSW